MSRFYSVNKDHKFEEYRGLSDSWSAFKTVVESLFEAEAGGGGGAPRTGGSAPDDICRNSDTLCGTVPLLPD